MPRSPPGRVRPEGKATASRNAVKHGLLAEQVVIHGEDPAQFDLYREGMLAELAPVGAVEAMLAERAVSLAWRLRRAERLQSAVFATVYRENANDVVLWPKHGLPIEPRPDEDEVILGQVVMTDFARAQVLDRLLVHERRIESSLYRTMANCAGSGRPVRRRRAGGRLTVGRREDLTERIDAGGGGRSPAFGGWSCGESGVRSFGEIGFVWRRWGGGNCNREPADGRESRAGRPCYEGAWRRCYERRGASDAVSDRNTSRSILQKEANFGRTASVHRVGKSPACSIDNRQVHFEGVLDAVGPDSFDHDPTVLVGLGLADAFDIQEPLHRRRPAAGHVPQGAHRRR